MPEPTQKEKRSKWHLSGILSSNSNKNTPQPDSTYGGSEPASSQAASTNTIPSISGSDVTRSSQYDPSLNQVITTTTTTTTTTTVGGQPQQTTTVVKEPTYSTSENRDSWGSNPHTEERYDGPPIPAKSTMRERSPNPPNTQPAGRERNPSVQIPPSTARERSPGISPTGPNFSYPYGRGGGGSGVGGGGPGTTSTGPHPSTLQGLKTAAVGIHGAGESLRGTLNAAVDRRFHASPETVAADERVALAGREEIESGRYSQTTRDRERQGVGGVLKKTMPGHRGNLRVVNE